MLSLILSMYMLPRVPCA